MGVNRVKSTRVTSVVLIHTQVLLATRGSLRDTFTEKLVLKKPGVFFFIKIQTTDDLELFSKF